MSNFLFGEQLSMITMMCAILCACNPSQSEEEMLPDSPTELRGAAAIGVRVSGEEQSYTFTVEVKSPDLGCTQYADWWEVITSDSVLLYRRILAHSHVDDQPFKRSGGPVRISASQEIIIRAHMNNLGYGQSSLRGSVQDGFTKDTLAPDFASHLALEQPLPGDCPH